MRKLNLAAIFEWIGVALMGALLLALALSAGWLGLLMVAIPAVALLAYAARAMIEKKFPATYAKLSGVGPLLGYALLAMVLFGGLFHSCTKDPEDCSANEARFGVC